MKASDSENSLTELTGRDECFICLTTENDKGEPLVSSKVLRTCGCKFFVHPACWNVWLKDKTDYDCPICRKQSLLRINIPPNPIFYAEGFEEQRRAQRPSYGKYILIVVLLAFGIGILVSLLHKN